MSNKAPIIIIEGPDFSGKSTLARHLSSLGYFYLHSSYESLRSWRRTFSANIGKPMVLDRCWISERVYGPVLRPNGDPNSWVQDRILVDRHDPIYIFCHRPFEASFEAQKKDTDHPYGKRAFKKIHAAYGQLFNEFTGDAFLKDRTHLFEGDISLNDIPAWLDVHQIPKANQPKVTWVDLPTTVYQSKTPTDDSLNRTGAPTEFLEEEARAINKDVPKPMYKPGEVIPVS